MDMPPQGQNIYRWVLDESTAYRESRQDRMDRLKSALERKERIREYGNTAQECEARIKENGG